MTRQRQTPRINLLHCLLALPFALPSFGFAQSTAGIDHYPSSFEQEVEAVQARLAHPPPEPIVFYGSSSIRLWRTLSQDFPGYPVVNCGFGGSRLTDCINFAPRLVLPLKPAALVLYAGDNDLACGTSPEQAFNSFRQLFTLLRSAEPKIPIAFISVKPCPARMGNFVNIARFNALVDKFLDSQPETDYIDAFSAMLGPDKKPIPSLFVSDQIHLSPAGYQILRSDVSEFLKDEMPSRETTAARLHTPLKGAPVKN